LKLQYDGAHSNSAFKFNWRRYSKAGYGRAAFDAVYAALTEERLKLCPEYRLVAARIAELWDELKVKPTHPNISFLCMAKCLKLYTFGPCSKSSYKILESKDAISRRNWHGVF
jgi:hypothetical protein